MKFFDPSIQFTGPTGIFYYPFHLKENVLIKTFSAFPASLELAITPRQFYNAEAVAFVFNLEKTDDFECFLPFFITLVEKQSRCPPFLMIGLVPEKPAERKISYYTVNALRTFISLEFGPKRAYYVEWCPSELNQGRQKILDVLSRVITAIDEIRGLKIEKIPRLKVKRSLARLESKIIEFKNLDRYEGLKYLVINERVKKERTDFNFPGYTRMHMINRGLEPALAKEILDFWESSPEISNENLALYEDIKEKIPDLLETLKKNLLPVNLYTLVSRIKMDVKLAKIVIARLKNEKQDVDLHDSYKLVEELKNIMEFIIIYTGQPIFSYLPNQKLGIGKDENISLISGMIHVLDILRKQVWTCSPSPEKNPHEKIQYGPLHLTISHGKLIKCVIHSLNPLSDDILIKMDYFVRLFEQKYEERILNYKGEVEFFDKAGISLYNDIFTPLPIKYVNKNWKIQELDDEDLQFLTNNQLKVYEKLKEMKAKGRIGEIFYLENILDEVSEQTMISISDLLLILPGELLIPQE
ncbi:MAG: hypothetical protein ACTSWN_07070 [Promethearchaeota archaeon]